MTPAPVFRKPKLHFDTASRPSHVTFDDGKVLKRNIPWSHYVEARWEYGEPDIVKIEIGGWLVVIRGHNLGPLFIAIEDQMLLGPGEGHVEELLLVGFVLPHGGFD
jgi:hypothetical protein